MSYYEKFLEIKNYILEQFNQKKEILEEYKPYIYSYNSSFTTYKVGEKFLKENRPMEESIHQDIILEKINLTNFSREDKFKILNDIWQDANLINRILKPLKDLYIPYTLDLTGGSVRDFLLDKHNEIKDLDFMLSIDSVNNGEYYKTRMEEYFSKEELEKVSWSRFDRNSDYEYMVYDSEIIKNKLLQLCFNRFYKDYNFFEHTDERIIKERMKGFYVNDKKDRLLSVLKLENPKFNYPIDILLTDFIKPEFLRDFDFDLCKASICFVNENIGKEFPDEPLKLINRVVCDFDFWADVVNKKLTYNVNDRSDKEIERSFTNHYIRLKDKYPEQQLNVIGDNQHAIKLIDSILLSNQLQKTLEKKEESKKTKKMKKL